jgi:hypothetical protein
LGCRLARSRNTAGIDDSITDTSSFNVHPGRIAA